VARAVGDGTVPEGGVDWGVVRYEEWNEEVGRVVLTAITVDRLRRVCVLLAHLFVVRLMSVA
jgi:hypothetical protein